MIRIFFVGGIFTPNQKELIQLNSKGVIQNAANAFQLALIQGLSLQDDCTIEAINLPFIGSFPTRFSIAHFPKTAEIILSKVKLTGLGFINIFGIKHFARFLSLYFYLRKNAKNIEGSVLLVYAAHTPFLYAVSKIKNLHPNIRIGLIIPDLPQFMSDNEGVFHRILKHIDTRIFVRLLQRVDYFFPLTAHMLSALNLPQDRAVVIEGIAHEELGENTLEVSPPPCRYIFYSGTLASRYGIRDLLEAFRLVDSRDIELWICGEGDARPDVEKASSRDERIKYLGQLDRFHVLNLQKQAYALINPRTPEGEFTKYSFPSKTIEYMLSGRPVIMHKLAGIPKEYFEHSFTPSGSSVEALAKCIQDVINLDETYLSTKGTDARNFVLKNKSAQSQTLKILKLIKEKYI